MRIDFQLYEIIAAVVFPKFTIHSLAVIVLFLTYYFLSMCSEALGLVYTHAEGGITGLMCVCVCVFCTDLEVPLSH